ncbi:MAG TPA: roadblock/LC7 domain-containing protein [Micromonosporaceae bacterium]|nr:roadblock/LC7 domain-containing protein [Micromonosporaceae bacterium]
MTVEEEVLAEIRQLRGLVPGVSGSLVASLDGLLVADDTAGIVPEGVAALAAAGHGVGQRMAAAASHGDLHATTITGAGGLVATYPAGSRALLTVLASLTVNVHLLHLEASQVAERVENIIEVLDVDSGLLDLADLMDDDDYEPDPPPARPAAMVNAPEGVIRQADGPAPPMPRRMPATQP